MRCEVPSWHRWSSTEENEEYYRSRLRRCRYVGKPTHRTHRNGWNPYLRIPVKWFDERKLHSQGNPPNVSLFWFSLIWKNRVGELAG